ncbi:delta(1)-pyrroline-2-carboxylate reductase family protein [Spiribacter vilamensis]|uniref:Ornithine cyclodeaminase n=1 Tax=Spiribacter vilamensis TaxID=531306 RepID=A0A4Q8D1W9_9GAMM|nr:delta(1)-pyrroline-2-carboxylate reductase family protein [Spiribacter vilamensis]RZU99358.1 ornithine cyclodeaminase [Spiribacter vilamensis]TVO61660.1 delta(1)-pyrroline-2-carboxylate reductase family protein [Spiribacter vilamensis]
MQFLDREQTLARLDYQAVADACADILASARAGDTECPPRGAMSLAEGGTLLLMPATDSQIAITKLVTVHPHNGRHQRPTIQGEMVVLDAATGERRLLVDGGAVSARRTAAVSLLAAQHLAPRTDTPVLVYGAGTQARTHLEAFRDGLGVRRAYLTSRTRSRAEALATEMNRAGMDVTVIDDPATVLEQVRLIVAATTATAPILPASLPADTFVAAVGAFRAHMAEIPPELIAQGRIVIDSAEGARDEAGDLIKARASGHFDWDRATTLEAVVLDNTRPPGDGPVIFKSVGQSLWDLAAGRVLVAAMPTQPTSSSR